MGKILETRRRNYSFTFLHVRLKAQNDSILDKYNDKKDFAKRPLRKSDPSLREYFSQKAIIDHDVSLFPFKYNPASVRTLTYNVVNHRRK